MLPLISLSKICRVLFREGRCLFGVFLMSFLWLGGGACFPLGLPKFLQFSSSSVK